MDDGAFAVLDYKQRETKRNKETVSSIFFYISATNIV